MSTAQRLNVPPLKHRPSLGSWMKNGLLLLLLLLLSRAFSRRLVAVASMSRDLSFSEALVEAIVSARTERVAALCMHRHLMALRRLLARVDPLRETERAMLARAMCICCLLQGEIRTHQLRGRQRSSQSGGSSQGSLSRRPAHYSSWLVAPAARMLQFVHAVRCSCATPVNTQQPRRQEIASIEGTS